MSRRVQTSALILIAAGAHVYGATAVDSKQFAILSATQGQVSVRGYATLANATVQPGEWIATGKDSAAKLILDRNSSTTILSDSQVSITKSTGSGLELRHGSMVVQESSQSPLRVQIPGAYVLIKGDGSGAAMCQVEAHGKSSKVTLGTGVAEIHGAGDPVTLRAGQYALLENPGLPANWPQDSGATPVPAAASGDAGKISREIPRGTLTRGTQTLPLNQNDPVKWNDSVHTLDSGRLQITLIDGSVLSVGSRSQMTIIKHDPDSQQTSIQLNSGKLRSDVSHITKTGGKFEVRTKTAVIGVVGTSFVVGAEDRRTRVCGLEGETTVQNSTGTPQTVRLHRGECTIIGFGSAPSNPVLNTSLLDSLTVATNLDGVAVGAAVGGTAASTTAIVVTVAVAAAAAAGGLAAGAALSSSSTNISPSAQ